MTKNEALRMGMDALVSVLANHKGAPVVPWNDALDGMKAALEAKDEPVAWMRDDIVSADTIWGKYGPKKVFDSDMPLYTTPPQCTWVGLTDEEIRKWWASENGLEDCDMCKIDDFILVARAIEAKLKEKNS